MKPFRSPGGLVPVPVGKACCTWFDPTNMFGDCSFTCCPGPPSPPVVAPPPPPGHEHYFDDAICATSQCAEAFGAGAPALNRLHAETPSPLALHNHAPARPLTPVDSSLAARHPLPIPAGLAGSVNASHLAHLPELFCGSVGSTTSPPPPLVDLDDGPSYVSGPASCGGPLPMPFPNGLAISQQEAVALAKTHAVRRAHAERRAPPPPHCRRGAHAPFVTHALLNPLQPRPLTCGAARGRLLREGQSVRRRRGHVCRCAARAGRGVRERRGARARRLRRLVGQ